MDATPQVSRPLPTLGAAESHAINRAGVIALVLLLVVGVVGNIGLMSLLQANNLPLIDARGEVSDSYVLVSFYDPDTAVVATLSNQVRLLDGGQAVAEYQFDGLIGGVLTRADGVYVGTADGKITRLDAQLANPVEVATVTGRIVAMDQIDDLGFYVAHGVGPFSDQYWVTYFETGATEPTFSTQVEFTITALDVNATMAYYGTANSRVGALDITDGASQWTVTLTRPVTRVLALEDGALVGDERGNLFRLAATGETIWETNITGYRIRGLAADEATSTFFVGDTEGDLYAINASGNLDLTVTVADDDIEDLYALDTGQKIIVPRTGDWQTLNPGALGQAGAVQQYQTMQFFFNLTTLLGILIALIYMVERWRARAARLLFRMWIGRIGYMLLLPALILILIFGYFPAFMAIYYSFTNFQAGGVVEFIGLENYTRILTADRFFSVGLGNMVLIVVTNIIKVITLPLLIAELIFWLKSERRRYIFRTLYLLPAVVPGLVAVYMWTMVYDPYDGLLNQTLALFGLPSSNAWLANEQTAIWAIIFAGFPFISAFPLLIYMGGLLNINSEMFEAARIDGASWWTRFWKIDFPLLKPQTMLLVFFAFNGAVSGFEHIFVFTRGGPGIATYVPGLQMYFRIAEGDFGYASAIGAILFIIVFIGTLVLVGNRRFSIALDNN